MLKLNNLNSPKGAHRNIKRIGRGQGSGQGTQAGKGHKGQKARSGGGIRFGFEGGSMPFYMRIPKSGTFTNFKFKTNYATVNLEDINRKFNDNDIVSKESLIGKGLIKGMQKNLPVKVLGNGKLERRVIFQKIAKFSKGAEGSIKQAGGQIQI